MQMSSPRVVDFLETALTFGNKALNIADVVVGQGGKRIESLQVRERSGATVLAVVRDGQPTANPGLISSSRSAITCWCSGRPRAEARRRQSILKKRIMRSRRATSSDVRRARSVSASRPSRAAASVTRRLASSAATSFITSGRF